MKHQSIFTSRDRTIDVAMTPMIDVVFMLLIFFVWTASFHVSELILPSTLTAQQDGQGEHQLDPELEDLERVVVRVGWQANAPTWWVNEVPVARFEDVSQRLKAVASIKDSLPVLVDPIPIVPLGHVIDVYDAAKQSGFQRVQFATPASPATH